jgi:DUF4097 and DUF4098 domain-containing protein YvlB
LPSKKTSVLRIVSAAILALSGIAAAGDVYDLPLSREFEVSREPSLEISNSSGLIVIDSHSKNVIKVEALKRIKAKDRDEARRIAEGMEIDFTFQNNSLTVQTEFKEIENQSFWDFLFGRKLSRSAWVEYNITVPKECNLKIHSTSADIKAKEIKGDIEIACTSGDIQLKQIAGEVEITVTSGDLILSRIDGNMQIDATSGDLRVEGLKGSLNYRSSSGDFKGEGIEGDLEIVSSSGDIRVVDFSGTIEVEGSSSDVVVEQARGSFSAQTTTGDIVLVNRNLAEKDCRLETSSGDIRLRLSEKQAGRLDLETVSGTLKVDFPMTVESVSEHRLSGFVSKSGTGIFIRTTSGDVLLSRL